MKKLVVFSAIVISCIANKLYSGEITVDTIDNFNGWNKKALVIDNEIIELIILPEIGGRVIHYGFKNDKYMAVNESTIGINYNPDEDSYGPWKNNWGYGGYKVWPAPQSEWNWPPPPKLAWGDYSYTINKFLPDSVLVYLESAEETTFTPGLVFSRLFKIYNNSTLVQVGQTIKNLNTNAQTWSIWDVTQTIVEHNNDKDYTNFNVYFPTSKTDIWHNNGPINNVLEINPGLSKYQYDKTGGKLFTFLEDGWVCFTDELDEQSYVKIFEVESGSYPDEGANFEIYAGNNYIELEVLSPMIELAGNGGTYTYNEYWYAAEVQGTIYSSNKAGIVREKLSYNLENKKLSGDFGVFNTGHLKYIFYNEAKEEVYQSAPIQVLASEKFTLDKTLNLTSKPAYCNLNAFDLNGKFIHTLAEWNVSEIPGFSKATLSAIKVYPTVLKKNEVLKITGLSNLTGTITIKINKADSKIIYTDAIILPGENLDLQLPNLSEGIYYIQLIYEKNSFVSKIVIY
jgi:hypothetical protein